MRSDHQNTKVAVRSKGWFACLTAMMLLATGVMLSSCNTTEGAGQDVSATGHAITRGAADVKKGL